jgi:hypothetical protein
MTEQQIDEGWTPHTLFLHFTALREADARLNQEKFRAAEAAVEAAKAAVDRVAADGAARSRTVLAYVTGLGGVVLAIASFIWRR